MGQRVLERWNADLQAPLPLFSQTAAELGARAQPQGWPENSTGSAARASLSFFQAGLPARDLKPLRGEGDLELRGDPHHGLRSQLELPLPLLVSLASGSDAWTCLLAAHEAVSRPPQAPIVMGILNLTPDSFSDGGRWSGPSQALEQALAMAEAGASVIDVGGESTRPGSLPVPAEEEIRRTEPLIRALAAQSEVAISIDTTKALVAQAAIDAGASMVNDVSAGTFDPEMLSLVAARDVDLVLMHMQKTPKDMQVAPTYEDPVSEVCEYLRGRVRAGLKAGIARHRMAIDPGIGFGKRLKDNLQILRSIGELRSLGLPVLVGASRKSMLGALSGQEDPSQRDPETLAAQTYAQQQGAEIHRVHAVQECVAALKISTALGGRGSVEMISSTPRSEE